MERVLTTMNEYAYNFLLPLNPVGSSGTVVPSSTYDRRGGLDSSYDALAGLCKPEVCGYKSILRSSDNFSNCDYFQPPVSQSGNPRGAAHDIQAGMGPIPGYSIPEDVGSELRSTMTEPGFVVALSLFLTQIATSNSTNASCSVGVLTPFHSVCIPPIPIRAYLIRLAQNFGCSNECFVLAIIYVGRMVKHNRNFTITLLNVHRVIVTALILATKFFDDIYYSNAFYAKVSGVETRELNSLEIHFLRLIKFQLFVTEHEYEIYKQCITKSAVPHSTVPSLPMGILSKQTPPDEAGSDVQLKDANFAAERKRQQLLSSSPYDFYPGMCNSLPHGRKLQGCDAKPVLTGEDPAGSQHNFTGNLFPRHLNPSVYGPDAESSARCTFSSELCGKSPSSESTSFPHFPRNVSANVSQGWLPQFSLSNCREARKELGCGVVKSRESLAMEDSLLRRTGLDPSASDSKIIGGNSSSHGSNCSFSDTSSDGYYDKRLLDLPKFVYNAESGDSSDGFRARAQVPSDALSQRRSGPEPLETRRPSNTRPDHASLATNSVYAGGDVIGLYGSMNTCDYNVLSGTDALASSAVTLVVNPAVSHYEQHMFIGPPNIRCTTGIDRRLLI